MEKYYFKSIPQLSPFPLYFLATRCDVMWKCKWYFFSISKLEHAKAIWDIRFSNLQFPSFSSLSLGTLFFRYLLIYFVGSHSGSEWGWLAQGLLFRMGKMLKPAKAFWSLARTRVDTFARILTFLVLKWVWKFFVFFIIRVLWFMFGCCLSGLSSNE